MQPSVERWLLPFLQESEFIYSFTSRLLLEPVELIIPLINNLSKGFLCAILNIFNQSSMLGITLHLKTMAKLHPLLFWSADK